jgi:O-antigen/teichoic acid export membrane protein
VAALLFGQADKFILYHFFGPAALASYWIASTIPQEVGRVISTVGQVAYPKFVKVDTENARRVFPRRFLMSVLILFGISLLYAVVAYPFFSFFFPAYIGEVSKSIVLMFAFAIIPHYFVWGYFSAKGRHKIIYLSNTLEPVLQISLYVALIPLFGIWGLVYSMLIKMVLMNTVAWYVLKKSA